MDTIGTSVIPCGVCTPSILWKSNPALLSRNFNIASLELKVWGKSFNMKFWKQKSLDTLHDHSYSYSLAVFQNSTQKDNGVQFRISCWCSHHWSWSCRIDGRDLDGEIWNQRENCRQEGYQDLYWVSTLEFAPLLQAHELTWASQQSSGRASMSDFRDLWLIWLRR